MFSENDRISQRQMERQIVLVLLCPAFWQLAAYGDRTACPVWQGFSLDMGCWRCGAFISCALAGFTAAWKA